MIASYQENCDKPRHCVKKQRHHFADSGPYSQGCGLSSSHVQLWELDHKEGWVLKNWCLQTVVLEKTLESLLDSKEIKPVNLKGNQPWILIGRTAAEPPILWPPEVNSQLIGKQLDAGKDWRQKKRETEDEVVGWHHQCNGHELGQIQGDIEGKGKPCMLRSMELQSWKQLSNWTKQLSPDFELIREKSSPCMFCSIDKDPKKMSFSL